MKEKILMFISNHKPWFYLVVNVLVGVLLAVLVLLINRGVIPIKDSLPDFLLTNPSLAETILSSLAGAWLSVTTFTFSITMVVLTTYSSNYSPRIVENFLQKRSTMRVLGTFIGGFIYNVSMLFLLNKSFASDQVLSPTVGILYAFWCIIQFVIFIFSVANAIQAQNLIAALYDETEENIDQYIDKDLKERVDGVDAGPYSPCEEIVATGSGYLAAVTTDEVKDALQDTKYRLVVEKKVGDFIRKGDRVARFYGSEVLQPGEDDGWEKYFPLEKKRYPALDYRYGMQKLVDITVRALSPGINDPNTAISGIHSLGLLTGSLAKIDGSYDVVTMECGEIYLKNHVFLDDIFAVYSQIVTYAQKDINVMIAVMDALEGATEVSTKSNLDDLKKISAYAYEICIENFTHPLDKEELGKRMRAMRAKV